jgi:hypothetical protein
LRRRAIPVRHGKVGIEQARCRRRTAALGASRNPHDTHSSGQGQGQDIPYRNAVAGLGDAAAVETDAAGRDQFRRERPRPDNAGEP